MTHPMSRPGEIAGWPKLVLRYPTSPQAVAALLPPGLEPCGEPTVTISVYNAPVFGEPELGVSTRIGARWSGIDGQFTLGVGIDQEAAIFISRETNGQPKFPCQVRYFRHGDAIEAHATHQGTTFLSFSGTTSGPQPTTGEPVEEHEWWIKASRAVASTNDTPAYDLPPMVVQVRTVATVEHLEAVAGTLVLRPSAWDPYTELLPMLGPATAELVTARFSERLISPAGVLDPVGFWPFADTIGGSRWPGHRGGPRRG